LLLDKETEIASRTIPVGCPVDGKTVLLLDEGGEPVGAGEIGEIAVRGRTLFRGYWRRPDLTEAVLQPAPAGGGERIFRTGDLGQMAPDGCLTHRGRKDFQVKVRGYRVEVAEVETALRDLDVVREAIVTAWKNDQGDSRLVACIVPRSGVQTSNRDGQDGGSYPVSTGHPVHPVHPCLNTGTPERPITVTALRRALAPALPEYMIPSAFVMMEELPRTATGKVDRKALPPPGRERPALEVPYAPPRTPVEETLVEIWAGVLELDTAGIRDSFFELGGHSLLATRALARLRERLGVELPLRALFEHPTIADLAALIAGRLADQTPHEEMDELLAELDELSEAEAQARLTTESGT
jgi:acyl carrier protein